MPPYRGGVLTAWIMPGLAVALGVGVALASATEGRAQEARLERSEAGRMQRQVTVTGEGKVAARPDMARISLGVVSEAATAKEALKANSGAMDALIGGLKARGIPADDIQTTNFDVSPRYVHTKDGKPPTIDGYRVSNDVAIVVRELAQLGPMLDEIVSVGANRIGGLSFAIADAEALKDEARRNAIANARQRADLYANAAGARLGQVLVISEETVHVAPRGPMLARAAMAEGVPIAEGSQEISARVTVTYALD
ncbi:MAG: SIMPL domain-containing protein [Hyphomicrobiaceae bacterium]|nr:SIMPL domain-containing protein [Hyphomicrobiaceae bacterium]MCC0007967.1 SIMPL domain-containing protein [Hyphomicrobiaceae bacterium]